MTKRSKQPARRAKRVDSKLTDEEREKFWATFSKRPKNVQFNEEIAQQILFRMANGETITSICRDKTMPCVQTVRNWATDIEAFATLYARAEKLQIEFWVDDVKLIADDGKNDWMKRETKRGKYTALNSEHVQRSKLRIDTIRWLASIRDPQKYAQKETGVGELFGAVAKTFAQAVDSANQLSSAERKRIAAGSDESRTKAH